MTFGSALPASPPSASYGWIQVRDAGLSDLATIVDFNQRLAQETESKILDPATLERGVARALADPDRLRYWVAFATDDESQAVRGMAAITKEWSDWRSGYLWWLQSVYVRADSRAQGIFKTLHRHIRSQALADPETIGLRLYVEDQNERAQTVYRNLGMTPGGYQVFQELWIPQT